MGGLEQFERAFVRPLDGRTLICGSKVYGDKPDRRKAFADVVGVDMQEGEGVDRVLNLEDEAPEEWLCAFAHAECMSTLEHCARPWLAARFIEQVLQPGGTLFVSLPWTWKLHSYPDDNFRVSPNGLLSLFPNIRWIERRLVTQREILPDELKKFPAYLAKNGDKFLQRTETCGFGVRA
jgi:SAM-dependent methyltransferase